MEQRRLRLGDILDDYCPRERRVTNHAVVAMIEDDVKQTRCTTCDSEHAYKGAKVPRKRKKETPSALYREVLSGMGEGEGPPVLAAPVVPAADPAAADAAPGDETFEYAEPSMHDTEPVEEPHAPMHEIDATPASTEASDEVRDDVLDERQPAAEEGPVHRPLIRATLPRPEGQKDERRIPEFTVRHNAGRGNGKFRGGDVRGKQRGGYGAAGGNRPQGGSRFAGTRPGGAGRGQGRGAAPSDFRSGQPQRHGGRKRSR